MFDITRKLCLRKAFVLRNRVRGLSGNTSYSVNNGNANLFDGPQHRVHEWTNIA